MPSGAMPPHREGAERKKRDALLNNNRNNRRRGRGNRNQSGGNQANRIDSRARGNAPQLLDKYKKLAQDAQHNGDRVQAEYYLQFADHYFRVIADTKSRQDEARSKRADEREQANDDSDDDQDEDNRRSGRSRRNAGDQNEGADTSNDETVEAEQKPRRRQARRTDEEKPARTPRRRAAKDTNGSAEGKPNGKAAIDASVLPPAIGKDDDAGDALDAA